MLRTLLSAYLMLGVAAALGHALWRARKQAGD